jgi:type IV pilus assembly protein PilQ
MMEIKFDSGCLAAIRHAAFSVVVALMLWPACSSAAEITALTLEKAPTGDVLSIHSDGELDYESFNLNAPPRLVLVFPHGVFNKTVQAISSEKAGINGVTTSASKAGARLDISMSKALTYKVEQSEHVLTLRFSPVSAEKPEAPQGAAVLKDIAISDRGEMTELAVRGEHMNASHDAFVTNQGRSLILDFWGATSELPKEHYSVSTQNISSVTVGKADGRVRLVVDLPPGVSDKYQVDATEGQMLVRIGSISAKPREAAVQVEDVQFKPDDRISHLEIRTDSNKPIINMHEEKDAAILDIQSAVLAKGQERTQNVSEFPGPLSQVDAYKFGDKVRIVARLREKVEISSFQQGNVLTITFVPKDIAAAKRGATQGEAFTYTGQKVSFDYQGIDIQNALRMIAEMSDMNIIMGDDVKGKLTMRLENVPWDQALDIILASQNLGKEVHGNVMRIAPLAVLTQERLESLKAQKSEDDLSPLITEFIPLNFAKASDVKTMLETVRAAQNGSTGTATGATSTANATSSNNGSPSNASPENGMLSSRGSFVVDERTNTLIVKDTQESINNIKRLVAQIDKPVKQVLIEARIVEATDDFTRNLGVRWGGQVSGQAGKTVNQVTSTAPNTGLVTTNGVPNYQVPGGFLVDLPAAGTPAGQIGLALGTLSNAFNLNLELSANEADGLVKIISTPRVMTTNNKMAKISQGQDVPFVTPATTTSPATVTMVPALLELDVTPQITADKRLLLTIKITKDAPTANTFAPTSGNPILNKKLIDTLVYMNNGETIVIGGIYTRDKEETKNSVPWLERIPILGWLFKNKQNIDKRTELLIFITPTIIDATATNSGEVAQQGM